MHRRISHRSVEGLPLDALIEDQAWAISAMEGFDALPAPVKDALREGEGNYSVAEVEPVMRRLISQYGPEAGVTATVAKIRQRNAETHARYMAESRAAAIECAISLKAAMLRLARRV